MKQNRLKALIIRNAYPFDFGGGERFPVDLASELAANNVSAIIVSRSKKLLDYARAQDIAHKRGWWLSRQNWGGWHTVLLPIYFAWQLVLVFWYLSLVIRNHIDVVHAQSRDDFIAATIAGRLLGRRVIWSDHADLKYIYANHRVWYKNPIGKIVYWLSRQTYAVALVSKNELKHIEESLGRTVPDNYRVAYMGVPSTKVTPTRRALEDKHAIIFGATSRLVTAKGIGELIEAFTQLGRPESRLWLFGEGLEAKRFETMASSNKRIVFWGFPPDTLSNLAACDVFVHPSYHEGFSISLIEAAKLGLPIIACDVGGNPELVTNEKNGLLVPAHDAQALAVAMEKLADNPDLRKAYGEASRKVYEANFIFENAVRERFLPLYE
ncbi:glycosyltransferase [Candidatus Saccharibacteria bacterium]|nr:glycosyltransferase [Candidatus Saccharibacteria bacterium]